MNLFKYSNDNKRYHTFNYYLRNKYKNKVFKVSLNANLGCPNRDGTKAYGGCTFCSSLGSGDYAGDKRLSFEEQYQQQLAMMRNKWPDGKPIAYFQAYTNTYAALPVLKAMYEPFMKKDEVVAIAIATRADCLEDDTIAYLQELTKEKDVWIELGLQSIYDDTAKAINRGHTLKEFEDAIKRLSKTDIKICVHLMNSLPNETKEMMVNTAKYVGSLPIHAIKIHMLHVIKNTKMGNDYLKHPFPLQSLEEYVDTVVEQLRHIPEEIVIERLTGDAVKEDLIAPEWTLKKTIVLNEIDKKMKALDCYQGDKVK